MERLDAAQARDHLEMIDRILSQSQPRLCSGGEYFVVWGIAGALITLIGHLAGAGLAAAGVLWCIPAVLVASVIFSVVRGRQKRQAVTRSSLVQREFFNVLVVTLGLAVIVDIAVFRIFPGIAGAAIWSVAEAIVLLYIGLHGNRRAQIGGSLIVVSLIVANFAAENAAAYVLAAGMLIGFAGFGLAELIAHD